VAAVDSFRLVACAALAGLIAAQGARAEEVLSGAEAWIGPVARVGPDGRARAVFQPEFKAVPALLAALEAGRRWPGLAAEPTTPLVTAPVPPKGPRPPPTPGRILLQGEPRHVEEALAFLRGFDRPLRSVDVRFLLCEVARDERRSSGSVLRFDKGSVAEPDATVYRLFEAAFPPGEQVAAMHLGARPFEGASLVFADEIGGAAFEAVLAALSKRGWAQFIARPRLVLTEGVRGSMEVLRLIPDALVVEPRRDPQVEPVVREVGLRLEATAVRVGEDEATLDLSLWVALPEESEEANTLPGTLEVHQRKVATRVTVRAGRPLVLGGLYLRRLANDRRGLPGLDAAVQWLDPLVSSRALRCGTTELVLTVQIERTGCAPVREGRLAGVR
jgi:type II secretory pathway component GspD/PulD (secretin)